MKTISVVNQKGGVGKTTTALAIGQYFYLQGKRVLFIDLDMQGNLTYALNGKVEDNAINVLREPGSIKDNIQKIEYGDLIASSEYLMVADKEINDIGKDYKLKEALELVSSDYDYCIIDNPPTLNILAINSLVACNGALIPVNADTFSLQGVGLLYKNIEAIKKYCNKDLKIYGILLTRYKARNTLTRDLTEMLEDTANKLETKVFSARIRECIALSEAETMKESIYTYAKNSNASKDYNAFMEELIKTIGE